MGMTLVLHDGAGSTYAALMNTRTTGGKGQVKDQVARAFVESSPRMCRRAN